MRRKLAFVPVFVLAFSIEALRLSAQQPAPAPTPAVSQDAPPPSTAPPSAPPPSAAPPSATATPAPPAKIVKGKGEKEAYTGPNTVVELAPTPMLDEEGKQRLDPDGKPMFNPPVRQQRDKKGHPLFDEAGKPVMQTRGDLGYDDHGKKLHVGKEKPPKMTPVSISRGTYTVDGVIGKAALNYDIADFKYLYLYAPGIGIAVVSNQPFPGATEQARAFDDKTLTVNIGSDTLQVASDKRLLGKQPSSAFVLLDRDFRLPSRYPVVGYGAIRKPPYMWPGSKPNAELAGVAAPPPPVPVSLMPKQLLSPCPAGQMRRAAPTALPGQVAPVQPCIPIAKSPPQTAKPFTVASTASGGAPSRP